LIEEYTTEEDWLLIRNQSIASAMRILSRYKLDEKFPKRDRLSNPSHKLEAQKVQRGLVQKEERKSKRERAGKRDAS
jgi:hypothetical protein